jgi:hypothetical protein
MPLPAEGVETLRRVILEGTARWRREEEQGAESEGIRVLKEND